MDLGGSPDVPVSDHAPLPSPDGSPDLADLLSHMANVDRLWSSIGSDPSDRGGSPSVPVPDHAPPPSPDWADILSEIMHADTHSSILDPWSPIGSDPLDWGGSPSVPVPDHAPPPGMDSTSWSELTPMFEMAGHGYTDGTQPAPDIPGSVAGSLSPPPPSSSHPSHLGPLEGHFPSPPGFSLNPDTTLELMRKIWMAGLGYTDDTQLAPDIPGSVPGSHPPPLPSSSHLSQLGPSEGHFPSQPDSPLNSDTSLGLMQMFGMAGHGYTDGTQPAPDIPGSVSGSLPSPPTFSPQLSQLEPTEGPLPSISNWLEMQVNGMTVHGYTDSTQPAPDIPGSDSGSRLPVGSMPVAGSLPPPPPASPHLGQLGPSEGRFPSPPDFSVNPGTPPSVGSTGGQPLHPEPIPSEFWENLLKDRIKRRISGSDAVY